MYGLFLAPFMATLALAAPADRTSGPSVTIKNGTVVGATSNGIDTFKGIPFAQPPVGKLRLKPPQPVATSFGTIQATDSPLACPQQVMEVSDYTGFLALPESVLGLLLDSPLGQSTTNTGEDCLTMQVYRPAGTKHNAKLPVVFWIFGGMFRRMVTNRETAGTDWCYRWFRARMV